MSLRQIQVAAATLLLAACQGEQQAVPAPADDIVLTNWNEEIVYHVMPRSFHDSNGDRHGDLAGFVEKLDYLEDLGVTTILFTPLYESDFYHNYFPTDYEAIDPEYGTMADYIDFVKAVHAKGMKFLMDMETQYAQSGHPWFDESYQNPDSEYSDFIYYSDDANEFPEQFMLPSGSPLTPYRLWPDERRSIVYLDLNHPRVRDYMVDFFAYWVDPNGDGEFDDGVDGFRIDHIMDDLDGKGLFTNLYEDFWRPIFDHARSINPDIFVIGEQADWGSNGMPMIEGSGADASFNFQLRFALEKMVYVKDMLDGPGVTLDPGRIHAAAEETAAVFSGPPYTFNFIENHDTDRWASVAAGHDGKVRAGAVLNLLLPGVPSIYYGQELGLTGEKTKWDYDADGLPFREAFPWSADVDAPGVAAFYKDSGEAWDVSMYRTDAVERLALPAQRADPDSLWHHYRELIALRKTHEAFRRGDYEAVDLGKPELFAFRRSYEDESILVVVNLSDDAASVPAHGIELAGWDYAVVENEELRLHVASPDWRDQVVYMLFIDRFDDGDPSNNDQGYGEYAPEKPTHFSGGDLQGVIDRVDYMKSLGMTAVWVSPPVANQWWSTPYQATGWHGYWAENFLEIDKHFGTLDDYKRLSHELHRNGMYLLQDIVINHGGNWFVYDGEYDPDNTAKNFRLLEPNSHQPAPSQPPFHMVDRLNPEHFEAEIYHWTPSIIDYNDLHQRFNYQLGALSDINTENPVVIEALKDTYKYWIEEVGVDGFRIDTIIYVPFEFWHEWVQGDDGIYAFAKELGKETFITLGESFLISDPFDDAGEREIVGFIENDGRQGLNSMLGFPMFQDINRVLGQGHPPNLLEYRFDKLMEIYPDPFTIPNFVDNHDTPRFLAFGHVEALKQALAVIFTIPGIPIIYQGTEQALPETRMAMFKGGHRNAEGSFDTESELFRHIQTLTALRTQNRVLTRGDLQVLAAESAGPGLLAYRREYEGDVAVMLFNSADHSILVNDLEVGVAGGASFDPLFSLGYEQPVTANAGGGLSMTLPARAVLVLRPTDAVADVADSGSASIEIDPLDTGAPFSQDFELSGRVDGAGAALELIINGNADRVTEFAAGGDGRWSVAVPVRDLGTAENYLQVHAPAPGVLSERVTYTTDVREATLAATVDDPDDDAYGPNGNYVRPQHVASSRQREIESVQARVAGRNLELTLTMAEITQGWIPPNGFDNVAITTFFSFPDQQGDRVLPQLNAEMPDDLEWNLAHFGTGWISVTYRDAGATADRQGEKLGVSPKVSADKKNRTITFFYEGSLLGVDDWTGATVYISTWDASGEGVYLEILPEPSEWFFSGGAADDPKIMDDVLLTLEVD